MDNQSHSDSDQPIDYRSEIEGEIVALERKYNDLAEERYCEPDTDRRRDLACEMADCRRDLYRLRERLEWLPE